MACRACMPVIERHQLKGRWVHSRAAGCTPAIHSRPLPDQESLPSILAPSTAPCLACMQMQRSVGRHRNTVHALPDWSSGRTLVFVACGAVQSKHGSVVKTAAACTVGGPRASTARLPSCEWSGPTIPTFPCQDCSIQNCSTQHPPPKGSLERLSAGVAALPKRAAAQQPLVSRQLGCHSHKW